MPSGWTVLRPPTFGRTDGDLRRYVDWLRGVLGSERGPVALGGHSMGGALAVLAAHDEPQRVDRLLLVSPAGLPLTKPMGASFRDFLRQLARRSYPGEVRASMLDALKAP